MFTTSSIPEVQPLLVFTIPQVCAYRDRRKHTEGLKTGKLLYCLGAAASRVDNQPENLQGSAFCTNLKGRTY